MTADAPNQFEPSPSASADFKKIICRRVPVKLKQFAKLLSDLQFSEVDSVRIKAMESQIRKTKEMCLEYQVHATANLLQKIESQLALDSETALSQKPLIKRFCKRLESHAERLQLGQIDPANSHVVSKAREQEDLEANPNKSEDITEDSVAAETEIAENWITENGEVEKISIEPEYEFKHSVVDEQQSHTKLIGDDSELTVYWCIESNEAYPHLRKQMQDFGYNIETGDLTDAIESASGDSMKVVIAQLDEFDDSIDEPINKTSQVIMLASQDTIEQRLKSVRLGSTLFFAEPIDTIKVMEYLDLLESNNKSEPIRIAVMEDSKAQAKYNDKVLSSAGFETCIITDPMQLLNELSNFDPEVIFMDMQMPGCNGVELTRVLRQQDAYKTVPIVFLSAEENIEKQREAMTSGGTAFIEKPVRKEQLLFTAELYGRRARSLKPHLAHDFRTGLTSPALLKEQITIESERAMRQNNAMFFALISLNQLSELNQANGYAFGERASQQLARLLLQRLRKTDCVGYFDSHRIGVVLSHCSDAEAEQVMSFISQTFAKHPISFQGNHVSTSLSVGISRLGKDYDVQRLVKRTEAALHQATNEPDAHLIWAHEAPHR